MLNVCKILPKNAKKFDENFLKYWGLSGAKACKSCRYRQELSNEYYCLLAKFGFDTAENESLKVHLTFKLRDLLFTYLTLVGTPLVGTPKKKEKIVGTPPRTRTGPTRKSASTTRSGSARTARLLRSSKLDRARSRLYRSQFLQLNTCWKALAEIYTMHSFALL